MFPKKLLKFCKKEASEWAQEVKWKIVKENKKWESNTKQINGIN